MSMNLLGCGGLMRGIKIPLQDFALKRQGGLCAKGVVGAYLRDTMVYNYTGYQSQWYNPNSRPCLVRCRNNTLKVLFIADKAISNYSLTSLILGVVYCLFYKARLAHTQSERVSRLYSHLSFDPRTSVQLTSHACSLACM